MVTQGSEFQSWGVMGDWDNKYISSSPEFVKNQLRCFQKLYDRVSIEYGELEMLRTVQYLTFFFIFRAWCFVI